MTRLLTSDACVAMTMFDVVREMLTRQNEVKENGKTTILSNYVFYCDIVHVHISICSHELIKNFMFMVDKNRIGLENSCK